VSLAKSAWLTVGLEERKGAPLRKPRGPLLPNFERFIESSRRAALLRQLGDAPTNRRGPARIFQQVFFFGSGFHASEKEAALENPMGMGELALVAYDVQGAILVPSATDGRIAIVNAPGNTAPS